MMLIGSLAVPDPAQAQGPLQSFAVAPQVFFPSSVPVGAQNQPAVISIRNNSGGAPIETQPVTVTSITFNPSCAAFGGEVCTVPEPRPITTLPVFDVEPPGVVTTDPVGPTATGRAGTVCAGFTFMVSSPDAVGTVTFTPSAPVILGPATGSAATTTCTFDFTFDALQRPLDGRTNAVVFLTSTTAGAEPLFSSSTAPIITVTPETTTIITGVEPLAGSPTPGMPLVVTTGTSVTDRATVTGVPFGPPLSGSVIFRLFQGPSTPPGGMPTFPNCLGAPLFVSAPIPVTPVAPAFLGAPPTATAAFTPPGAPPSGNFVFLATYDETDTDVSYSGSIGDFGDPGEQFIVQAILPSIAVEKTADPTVVNEPGGLVEFIVRVINTGPNDVTLTSLVDSVDGLAPVNLNGQGTCATAPAGSVPPTAPLLAARGGEYTCKFDRQVAGQSGETEPDVVTAIGTDANGNTATANDDAVVTIIGTPPAITVIKDAAPLSRP